MQLKGVSKFPKAFLFAKNLTYLNKQFVYLLFTKESNTLKDKLLEARLL